MELCGCQQSARSRTHKAGGQRHSAAGAGGCSVPSPTQCALRALWCAGRRGGPLCCTGMLCYALGGVTGRVSSNGGGGELDGQSACWCGSLDCLFAAIACAYGARGCVGTMHARRVLVGMPVAALAAGGPPIARRACVPHAALCPCFYFIFCYTPIPSLS